MRDKAEMLLHTAIISNHVVEEKSVLALIAITELISCTACSLSCQFV
jgi:hypothetical protein